PVHIDERTIRRRVGRKLRSQGAGSRNGCGRRLIHRHGSFRDSQYQASYSPDRAPNAAMRAGSNQKPIKNRPQQPRASGFSAPPPALTRQSHPIKKSFAPLPAFPISPPPPPIFPLPDPSPPSFSRISAPSSARAAAASRSTAGSTSSRRSVRPSSRNRSRTVT